LGTISDHVLLLLSSLIDNVFFHHCYCHQSFSYENEHSSHEHICSLGIPVGAKLVCHHCNVHFASYAYLAALQHKQFCTHNPTTGYDNGWAYYVTDIL
jgi:hypothetical protein